MGLGIGNSLIKFKSNRDSYFQIMIKQKQRKFRKRSQVKNKRNSRLSINIRMPWKDYEKVDISFVHHSRDKS